jgi:hypothetical protein
MSSSVAGHFFRARSETRSANSRSYSIVRRDGGFFQEDFARSPPSFEQIDNFRLNSVLLKDAERYIFSLRQEQVQLAMDFNDGDPFGLSRMCSKYRHHAGTRYGMQHFVLVDALLLPVMQASAQEPLIEVMFSWFSILRRYCVAAFSSTSVMSWK